MQHVLHMTKQMGTTARGKTAKTKEQYTRRIKNIMSHDTDKDDQKKNSPT